MMRLSVIAVAALAVAACSGGSRAGNNVAATPANTAVPATPAPANAQLPAAANATEWQTTASGLRYRRTQGNGTGPKPTISDTVTIHYVGRLMDGTEFDSSISRGEPATMALSGLIEGWQEGVPLMSVGDTYEFQVPPELGYGPQGGGPIPPNATLQFTIGLLAIAN